jgi:predicted DNA-binding transcriptional regulator AlpA
MSDAAFQQIPRLLRLSQILPTVAPISKSTLLRLIERGEFPRLED